MSQPLASFMAVAVIGLIVFFTMVVQVYRRLYRQVGPNEVMVISGGPGQMVVDENGERHRLGFRVVRGGGCLVNPILERVEVMSLEVIPLEFAIPAAETRDGHRIRLEGMAQLRFMEDDAGLRRAVSLFLSKPTDRIRADAAHCIEGHVLAAAGALNVADITAPGAGFSRLAEADAAQDLSRMGMEFVSFSVRPTVPDAASAPVPVS